MIDHLILTGLKIVGAVVILGGGVWGAIELWWGVFRCLNSAVFLTRAIRNERERLRQERIAKAAVQELS